MSEITPPEESNTPADNANQNVNKPEDMVPEELRSIFEKLPESDRRSILMFVRHEMSVKHSVRKGPLPHPEELKMYNDAVHDGAHRIIKMAEDQLAHRINIEEYAVKEQLRQSGKGQNLGFLLAIVVMGIAGTLAGMGHETFATVVGSIDIIGLVSVFVLGKQAQTKDLKNKNK